MGKKEVIEKTGIMKTEHFTTKYSIKAKANTVKRFESALTKAEKECTKNDAGQLPGETILDSAIKKVKPAPGPKQRSLF